MADISTIVPKIHADMWRTFYERQNVWLNKVMDVTGVFPRAGKTYQIPIDITPYDADAEQAGGETAAPGGAILADDSANFTEDSTVANLTWGAPRLQKVEDRELTLNQERESNILIPPLAELRSLPSLMANATMMSAYVVQKAISEEIRGKFNAQSGDYALAGPQLKYASGNDQVLWDSDDHRRAIYKLLRDATIKADGWQWPDANRVCVVGPDNFDLLAEIVVKENIFQNPAANAAAFQDSQVLNLRGWRIEKDKAIPTGTDAASDDNHTFYFMSERMGVYHAREYREVRTFNSEVYKGWLSRLIVTWGTEILNERYQFRGTTSITPA